MWGILALPVSRTFLGSRLGEPLRTCCIRGNFMSERQTRLTRPNPCAAANPAVTVAASRGPATQLPRRAPAVADFVLLRPMNLALRLVVAVSMTLASCQSPDHASAPPAFSPSISASELSYIFHSVLQFADSPAPAASYSAKHFFVNHLGGLRGVPLLIELPDQSFIRAKLSADTRGLLLSGYASTVGIRCSVSITRMRGCYHVRINERPDGFGCGSEFDISTSGGHVFDRGVICIDPA